MCIAQSREEEMDPARVGHPLQRCLNVVEDLLSMQEAKPFATPVRTSSCFSSRHLFLV